MKRTQRKDALRNIRKQIISFFSILIVVALGTGIFLTCLYGSRAIADRGNAFYRDMQYRDIQVIATKGIARADVRAVKELDGVVDAEPIFSIDLFAEGPSQKTKVRVLSRTERLDLVMLQEGAFPEKSDECAVSQDLLDLLDLSVGDTMVLRDAGPEEKATVLKENTFRITGVVLHPDHIHAIMHTGYNVILPREAFDVEAAGVDNTSILVRADTDSLDTFSQEYSERINDLQRRLVALGKERAALRDDEILTEAEGQLAEGSDMLADAREQLDAVREQIKNGEIALESAAKELETNKAKLDSAKVELDAAEKQLADGKTQLDAAEQELDAAKAQLDASREQLSQADAVIQENRMALTDAKNQLDIGRAELDLAESEFDNQTARINAVIRDIWFDDWGEAPQIHGMRYFSEDYHLTLAGTFRKAALEIGVSEEIIGKALELLDQDELWLEIASEFDRIPDGELQYEEGLAQYEEGLAQLQAGEQEYRAGQEAYSQGLSQYEESFAAYEARKSEYNVSQRLFETNKKSYEEGLAQYEAGLAEYESAREKLASGEAEFAEKEKEYQKGEEDYALGQEQLAAYQPGNWVTTNRHTNIGWHDLNEGIRTFHNIGNTFAILFVLLGALVCYATIGKIIDEQRTLVGTTKALGFTNREIFHKYLLFGAFSSLLGCIAGIALAYSVLQGLLVSKEAEAFRIGQFPRHFSWLPAVITVVLGVLLAAVSAWMACRRLLQQPATRLISGEVPPTFVKKEKNGPAKESSLYRGLILRNIRTDIKRVIVTIISIAGSCLLLLVGFTSKYSFINLIDRQFDEIINHDLFVSYLPERTATARQDIEEILRHAGVEYMPVYKLGSVAQIGADQEFVSVVCGDPDWLRLFYRLTDVRRNKEMRIPDEGVVVFRRLAEVYGLDVGDHISLLDESGAMHDVPVSGICETFAGRTMFLSRDYARKTFGDVALGNTYLVRLNGTEEAALRGPLSEEESLLQIESYADDRQTYESMSSAIDTVILVMLLMAGIMAAVVLLNMIRIQINQKKRELTIMRVNGFTTRETIGYILRENVITTILGIALGIVAGNFVAQLNLRATERVEMQMIRGASLRADALAALITLAFAIIMNYLALRKIKYLKLSDVND